MQIPERLIRQAKQRALSGFALLVDKTVAEADLLLSKAPPNSEQRGINTARALLRTDGARLRQRMGEHYAVFLDRALQTMHTDLRAGLHTINADNLTLIDDDVVVRQMEVDRLVTRLRDADTITLGRINLVIAQLHDEVEVKERENPFRPYLLARSLHEGLREVARDETTQRLLFDTISLAMASQLSGFYAAILEVFEAGGFNSRLTARPSVMTRAQRDRLAWQKAAEQLISHADPARLALDNPQHAAQARILPQLKQLMDMQGQGNAGATLNTSSMDVTGGAGGAGGTGGTGGTHAPAARQQAHALQDLVWEMFKQPTSARFPQPLAQDHAIAAATPSPGRTRLDMQLMQMQRAAARDLALDDAAAAPQPLDVRGRITEAAPSDSAKFTMDLVSLLFESIVHDDQLPAAVRKQLGLLQVPFLRAAILDPSMLHDAEHPARRLLDRIGTVASGMAEGNTASPALQAEITRALGTVLESFDGDTEVFATAEQELDAFVSQLLPASDPLLAPYAAALDEAESEAARLPVTSATLAALLAPLHADPRVVAFVTDTWARVLAGATPQALQRQQSLLADLLWSAQEKIAPEERTTLMRMLPELVKRVREGLLALRLQEKAESKAALDLLVNVHMDVLGNKQLPALRHMSLDEWRAHFALFEPGRPMEGMPRPPVPEVSREGIEAALARRAVAATLMTAHDPTPPHPSEADWLDAARAGAGFEILFDSVFRAARLNVVSAQHSLFLFVLDGIAMPTIYTRAALLTAMRTGALHTKEHAPVFERAVESLLAGADALAAKQ